MSSAKKLDQTQKMDPFRTRKTKSVSRKIEDTLAPPKDIKEAIDAFREAQEQARHFEGETVVYKDQILDFARKELAKRIFHGAPGTFKMEGNETLVTYIIQDSSAGLTEEESEQFAAQWGGNAAADLIEKDFATIRMDPQVLKANYEKIVGALQILGPEVLENLFKPMLLKAKEGSLERIKKYVKSEEEFIEILKQLKIKNYIK